MKIIRIYNNNVVVTVDKHGNETIVTGKGLAFQKKVGDEIEQQTVEKTFILKDEQIISRLEEVLKDTPSIYLEIADEIVGMLHERSTVEISDNIYVTLIDHIKISLERERKGIVLANPLLVEIKQYYSSEYALACRAAVIIEKYLGLRISESEIGFIALHIVNASMTNRFEDTTLTTKIIQEVLGYIEQHFRVQFNTETILYARFVRHLQFFAKRVISRDLASSDEEDALYKIGRREYPGAYLCVVHLVALLEKKYNLIPSRSEQGYLIYHIQNLITENRKK